MSGPRDCLPTCNCGATSVASAGRRSFTANRQADERGGAISSSNSPCGFTAVGGGWFLDEADQEFEGTAELCDSLAAAADVWYGPAKWGGAHGPCSARKLLEVRMRNHGAWLYAIESMEHEDGPDPGPASPWPGVISVTDYGRERGLGSLDGVAVASRDELLALVRPAAEHIPGRQHMQVSPQGRAAAIAAQFPVLIDGDDRCGCAPLEPTRRH